MMTDPDEMPDEVVRGLLDLIGSLQRQVIKLQAANHAIVRIMAELSKHASPEVIEILGRYSGYCHAEYERVLLELEKKHPRLAAELDKDRGPFPPQEPPPFPPKQPNP